MESATLKFLRQANLRDFTEYYRTHTPRTLHFHFQLAMHPILAHTAPIIVQHIQLYAHLFYDQLSLKYLCGNGRVPLLFLFTSDPCAFDAPHLHSQAQHIRQVPRRQLQVQVRAARAHGRHRAPATNLTFI